MSGVVKKVGAANMVSLLRIALIPVFLAVMYAGFPFARVVGLAIFLVCALTDWIDGQIARRLKQVTVLGQFLDPLADKLLVTSALLVLVGFGELSAVAAIIILAREFIITSLRVVGMAAGRVIPAGIWGKVKTVVQLIVLSALIPGAEFMQTGLGYALTQVLVWLMVGVTVWSGVEYLMRNSDILFTDKKK